MNSLQIIQADLADRKHQDAVVAMMDAYACDPMGNGKPLSSFAKQNLVDGLRRHPTTLIFLAFGLETACGIAVCFRGFSTFAAKPLINVSDFYVDPQRRGQGVGRKLLHHVEIEARESGCCKMTLEVQENNSRAREIYGQFGFRQAVYVQEAGGALSMSKPLG